MISTTISKMILGPFCLYRRVFLSQSMRLSLSVAFRRRMEKLVIDTDGYVDDARAIVLAMKHSELLAITTVTGSNRISMDQVVSNVSRLRRLCHKENVPIYRGCSHPIVPVPFRHCASFFFGTDGFGDQPMAKPELTESDKSVTEPDCHAAQSLLDLCNKYSGHISLVALGPLTNIALALKLDPKLGEKLKRVVIMGGSLWGIGNVSSGLTAEYNFYADPEAARIVLEEMNCQITVVPWEMYLCVGLPKPIDYDASIDIESHLFEDTSVSRFLNAITEHARQFSSERGRLVDYCDEIAVAVAIDESVGADTRTVHATVELRGETTRGQMAVNWPIEGFQEAHAHHEKNVKVLLSYDLKRVNDLMIEAVKMQP